MAPPKIPREEHIARFWSKVAKTEGCWEWQGSRAITQYGTFYMGGHVQLAHRIAYELTVGPIPPHYVICHKCDNPPCVRPDHLFAGTHRDNMKDMAAKGRNRNGWPSQGPSPFDAGRYNLLILRASHPELRALKDRLTRASRARNMTLAQYIAALVELIDHSRALADAGDARIQAELVALGLQTVGQ